MIILPKAICSFNAVLIKILISFFTETKKNYIKFTESYKILHKTKISLIKRSNA